MRSLCFASACSFLTEEVLLGWLPVRGKRLASSPNSDDTRKEWVFWGPQRRTDGVTADGRKEHIT